MPIDCLAQTHCKPAELSEEVHARGKQGGPHDEGDCVADYEFDGVGVLSCQSYRLCEFMMDFMNVTVECL